MLRLTKLKMIDVFIIYSAKRSIDKLVAGLSSISFLNINIIEGVFINSENDLSAEIYDSSRAKLIYGRNLSLGEIGCALAHNICRKKAAKSSNISLILEDDVAIFNLDALHSFLLKLESEISIQDNIVINIAKDSWLDQNLNYQKLNNSWSTTLGATPLAAAYIVTPRSALALYIKNLPISFLADWPPAKVRFGKSRICLFIHDSNSINSLISKDKGKKRSGFSNRELVSVYTAFYFVKNINRFNGFMDFLSTMWLPRVRDMLTYRIGV